MSNPKRALRKKRSKVVEQCVELRLSDLLRLYKTTPTDRRIGFNLGCGRFEAEFCFRGHGFPTVQLFKKHSESREMLGLGPQLQFDVYRPPFGGWSAEFICPGIRNDGLPCRKRVRSLYIAMKDGEPGIECRHCLGLKFASGQHWRIADRVPQDKEVPAAPRRRRNSITPVPLERPVTTWHDDRVLDNWDREQEKKWALYLQLTNPRPRNSQS